MGSAIYTQNCRPLLRSGETSVQTDRQLTESAYNSFLQQEIITHG